MKFKNNREKRHFSIRKSVKGTSEKPRLAVFRSNKHIAAQIIDDVNRITLVSFSSTGLKKNKETKSVLAKEVGKKLAEKAIAANIEKVVFDRGGYKYHGRIKLIAEGARENGLKF